MSRETYVPPPTTPPPPTQHQPPPQPHESYPGAANQGMPAYMDTSKPVQYLCGDCNSKVTLKRGDPIRCKECGHRVLYKERTARMVQFEAR